MTSNATTQTEALLLTETQDGIATLTLNRPGQFNALSSALIDELQSTFDRLAADPTVRVVVLAANGRGFCAGMISRRFGASAKCPKSSHSSRAAAA
jgi:enoyl-CoA hydratase/carnithine racemase